MKSQFFRGIIHGIPIALGYLSVSFGFGILAVRSGLSVTAAVAISITNLTSAGQAAGVGIIAASGTYLEMALTQLVINIRYALMGLSLSQKLDSRFCLPQRLICAYGITDEIFAVAVSRPEKLQPRYLYGLIMIAFLGWTTGTFLGAAAGQLLPEIISNAMGVVLYGMFLAIIIPPARKNRSVLCVVLLAALLSILCRYVFTAISGGFAVILCAVIAAAAGALFFPVPDEAEEEPL